MRGTWALRLELVLPIRSSFHELPPVSASGSVRESDYGVLGHHQIGVPRYIPCTDQPARSTSHTNLLGKYLAKSLYEPLVVNSGRYDRVRRARHRNFNLGLLWIQSSHARNNMQN